MTTRAPFSGTEADLATGRLALLAGVATTLATALLFSCFEHPWTLRLDNKLVIFPMTLEAWRSWMAGRIPLWSNGAWMGFPLLADPQTAAFYPLHLLPFALTPDPHLRAFDLATALHAGLLVAGTVRLAGDLGAGRLAALLGGALVLLGTQVQFWAAGFLPCFSAIAWWPWGALAAERLARPGRALAPDLALGSAALGAQALAGYPEFALYGGTLAVLWLLARAGRPLRARALRTVLLALGAILFAAPQLLPTAREVPDSYRRERVPFAAFEPLQVSARGLLDATAAGPSGQPAFVGAATLVLAACGLPRAPFVGAVAVAAAVVALGERTPLYRLVAALPPFHLFRSPLKFMAVAELAVAWLAALGLHHLLGRGRPMRTAVACALALGAVAEHATVTVRRFPLHTRLPTAEAPLATLLDALRGDVLPVVRASGSSPPGRVLFEAPIARFGNLGMLYDIESFYGGMTGLLSPRHLELARLPLPRAHLDLFGVQLAYVPDPTCPVTSRLAGFEVVRRGTHGCVLRNPAWPARYAFLSAARAVRSEDDMAALVEHEPEGPVPVLAPADEIAAHLPSDALPGSVTVSAYRPGAVELRTRAHAPAMLLVRESWKAGWTATVDGAPAPIRRAAWLFFAVPVPAGEHAVRLVYRDPSVVIGIGAAGLWMAVVLAAGATRRRLTSSSATIPASTS